MEHVKKAVAVVKMVSLVAAEKIKQQAEDAAVEWRDVVVVVAVQ